MVFSLFCIPGFHKIAENGKNGNIGIRDSTTKIQQQNVTPVSVETGT